MGRAAGEAQWKGEGEVLELGDTGSVGSFCLCLSLWAEAGDCGSYENSKATCKFPVSAPFGFAGGAIPGHT